MTPAYDCDVAVVGGGPVGAAVALGLTQRGLQVRLLDRDGPAPRVLADGDDYDLRVYALAPSCIAFLEQLGVWPAMAATRVSPYTRMQVWERDPATALPFSAADARVAALGSIVESGLLSEALWAPLPAGVAQRGVTVTRLAADDAGIDVGFADGSALRARLVVLAEGRDARLREQLGIESLSGRYEQTAVVCHVETERPHAGTAWQRFLASGPLAFLPLADGRSSIVWSSAGADALLALDDDDFRRALGDASEYVLGEITGCTRRVSFPLGVQHAERYVAPRAVLVGDAAHVVHPLAGQGVNLGLGDAQALVALLADAQAAGRDLASPRLLKRYERQRRADVIDMLAVTDGLYRAFRMPWPGLSAVRGFGFQAVSAMPPLRRELIRRAVGV
ncbi:FAD-dependent oxidoreductase [Solimonas marina]|uniref:UbiH/UbiF family hydroxylase n=1 Tax=Solimonas marina TaxID=2714601 RepID=A0A970B8L5_9GAMM|nr:FAD-dependent oxidoreductase [Solimonas marina]NKF22404.1 UbiH/UbiF family hydroxylase [Solimonas marina]